jgi:hypothetical protein
MYLSTGRFITNVQQRHHKAAEKNPKQYFYDNEMRQEVWLCVIIVLVEL